VIANRSCPACTVIQEIGYPDVTEAADWLCDVFGFTVRVRIANHRAQLNVGDGAVVVVEDRENERRPFSLMVRVEDVDRHHERSTQRGLRILRPPKSHPYGERQYTVEDFAGNRWTFTQSVADVAPEEWGGTSGQLSPA